MPSLPRAPKAGGAALSWTPIVRKKPGSDSIRSFTAIASMLIAERSPAPVFSQTRLIDVAVGNDSASERLEENSLLRHTYRWLKPGGVLILVIPASQIADCGNILSIQFKDAEVYRLSEPECIQYKQVVFAIRRSRRERERLQEREISWWRLEMEDL